MKPLTVPIADRVLLTVEAAAELLSISRTSAYEHVRAGRLRTVVLGARRRVPRSAVDELAAELVREAAEFEANTRLFLRRRKERRA